MKVSLASRAFTFLNLFCQLGEFFPSLRRLLGAILLEKILAIIENSGVRKPRERSQFVPDGVVLDDAGEVFGNFVLLEILFQINGMRSAEYLAK